MITKLRRRIVEVSENINKDGRRVEEFYVNVICFDKVEIIQLKTGRSRERGT